VEPVGEPQTLASFDPLPAGGEATTARYLFLGSGRETVFVDHSIERLWGLTAAELRHDPRLWLQRIHPDDRERVARTLAGPSGSSWDLDYRVVRDDGSTVRVQDRGRALNRGRSRQVAGRVVDVTRQRLLEERLRFQAQLLDGAGEAVTAVDAAGAITSWNPAAAGLLGWSAEEALGSPLVELAFAAAERSQLRGTLRRVLADGSSWSGELRLQHRDGQEVPARVTLSPLFDAGDEVVGVVAVAFDLSALYAAQARTRESEERQHDLVEQLRRLTSHLQVVREQEQTRIAREIHDELGQMLTALKLDVAWLQRRAAGNASELPAERLRERLAGLAQLVDEALDSVRNVARQLHPPALEDLGLESAIEWLVEEFRTHSGIPCELHSDLEGLPDDGERDTAAFRILQESLTNVARHAGARHTRVDVSYAGGDLVLVLRDDGVGMPAAALRASTSLGLLGMRERARACGGELSVRRLPRGGTQVRARLPVAPSIAERAPS
jgi:two-component system, NarL family, sensor histidine kinase UhpB